MAKTNHLEALAAAAGALAAVGLLVLIMLVVEARPAGATFPGKNGKIAYHGSDGNDFEIYTIKAGGGGRVQLTHNTRYDTEPSYSPNGKRIAYAGFDGNDFEIYTIKAGGGGKFNVTHNTTNDFSPSWRSRQ
jgi:Tol biopolymer transport system component